MALIKNRTSKNGKSIYFQLATDAREGDGTPLQYSCLKNPMDGGAWQAAVHGVTKSLGTAERLHFQFSLSCTGEGNGNPLQCSCLENPRDRGAQWAAVYGVGTELDMTEATQQQQQLQMQSLEQMLKAQSL